MELRAARDVVYVVDRGVLDARAIAGFTLGQCHGLALAVHDHTGWPMLGAYNDGGECQHILTREDGARLVDITGARTETEVLGGQNVDRLAPIDRAAIRRLVAEEGWAPADTEAAAYWLDEVITRGRSGAKPLAAQ